MGIKRVDVKVRRTADGKYVSTFDIMWDDHKGVKTHKGKVHDGPEDGLMEIANIIALSQSGGLA